jgi:hypothetical protein
MNGDPPKKISSVKDMHQYMMHYNSNTPESFEEFTKSLNDERLKGFFEIVELDNNLSFDGDYNSFYSLMTGSSSEKKKTVQNNEPVQKETEKEKPLTSTSPSQGFFSQFIEDNVNTMAGGGTQQPTAPPPGGVAGEMVGGTVGLKKQTQPSGIGQMVYDKEKAYRETLGVEDTPTITDIKETVEQNKDKEFVQRIINKNQGVQQLTVESKPIKLADGSEIKTSPSWATHLMAYAEADGKYYVYPEIVNQGGKLVRLGRDEAFDYAMKTGEFIEFDTEKEAAYFGENYKQLWMTEQQKEEQSEQNKKAQQEYNKRQAELDQYYVEKDQVKYDNMSGFEKQAYNFLNKTVFRGFEKPSSLGSSYYNYLNYVEETGDVADHIMEQQKAQMFGNYISDAVKGDRRLTEKSVLYGLTEMEQAGLIAAEIQKKSNPLLMQIKAAETNGTDKIAEQLHQLSLQIENGNSSLLELQGKLQSYKAEFDKTGDKTLVAKYNQAFEQYNTLLEEVTGLAGQYKQITAEKGSLVDNYIKAVSEYGKLSDDYESLLKYYPEYAKEVGIQEEYAEKAKKYNDATFLEKAVMEMLGVGAVDEMGKRTLNGFTGSIYSSLTALPRVYTMIDAAISGEAYTGKENLLEQWDAMFDNSLQVRTMPKMPMFDENGFNLLGAGQFMGDQLGLLGALMLETSMTGGASMFLKGAEKAGTKQFVKHLARANKAIRTRDLFLKNVLPMASISHREYVDAAKQMGLNHTQALAYSTTMSFVEGLSELIMPDAKLVTSAIKQKALKAYVKNLATMSNGAAQKILWRDLGSGALRMLKNSGKETLEEYSVSIAENLANFAMSLETPGFEYEMTSMNELLEIGVGTMMFSGLIQLPSGMNAGKKQKAIMAVQLAENFDEVKDILYATYEPGKAEQLLNEVRKYQAQLSKMPDGISDYKKAAIAELLDKSEKIQNKIDEIDDPKNPMTKVYQKLINSIQEEISGIIDDQEFDKRAQEEIEAEQKGEAEQPQKQETDAKEQQEQEAAQQETPIQEEQVSGEQIDVNSLEGKEVNYLGEEGVLVKEDDGYYVRTKDGDIFVERGESGLSADKLGINEIQSENVASYNPEDSSIDYNGKKYTYQKVNLNDNGDVVSVTVIDENGKEKTIRNQQAVAEIEIQKTLSEMDGVPTPQEVQETANELNIQEDGQQGTTKEGAEQIQQTEPVKDTEKVEGETIGEQAVKEPVESDEVVQPQTTERTYPIKSTQMSNREKQENTKVVEELQTKPITRVEGLGMGQNQAKGTFFSTEETNRYDKEGNAKSYNVEVERPFVSKGDPGLVEMRNEFARNNFEAFKENGGLENMEATAETVTVDDLSQKGIDMVADMVTEDLKAKGYDSIYFPQSDTQEGELVVFDENSFIERKPGVKGKKAKIVFAEDIASEGRVEEEGEYELVEADNVQASHDISGVRNKRHTISEAQPKERGDKNSRRQQDKIAENPEFEMVGESPFAYFGAPVVNQRNEVVQGNNRTIGLKKHYNRKGTKYKEDLAQNAEKFGFTKEQVMAMKNPLLVRKLNISDSKAVEYGNMDVKDIETGGEQFVNPKTVLNRLSNKDKSFLAGLFFDTIAGEASVKNNIRKHKNQIFGILKQYLSGSQMDSLMSKTNDGFNQKGMDAIEDIANFMFFDGASPEFSTLYEEAPGKVRITINSLLKHLFATNEKNSLLSTFQNAVLATIQFSQNADFDRFEQWIESIDVFTGTTPIDTFTPLELKIAEALLMQPAKQLSAKVEKQLKEKGVDVKKQKEKSVTDKRKDIINDVRKYNELVNGVKSDLFGEDVDPIPKSQAIEQVYEIKEESQSGEEKGTDEKGTQEPVEQERKSKEPSPKQEQVDKVEQKQKTDEEKRMQEGQQPEAKQDVEQKQPETKEEVKKEEGKATQKQEVKKREAEPPAPSSKEKFKSNVTKFLEDKGLKGLDKLDDDLKKFGGENLGMNIPVVVAQAAVKAAKIAMKATTEVSKVVDAIIDAVQETDWYKGLKTQKERDLAEENILKFFSGDQSVVEKPEPEEEKLPRSGYPEQIGITNAYDDKVRSIAGRDPIIKKAKQANEELWDKVLSEIDDGTVNPRATVEKIAKDPNPPINDELQAIILFDRIYISNELEAAAKKLNENIRNNDQEGVAEMIKYMAQLEEMLDMNEHANRKAGSTWGKTGQFRQVLAEKDFSLVGVIERAKAMNFGKELSPSQERIFNQLIDEIERLNEKYNKLKKEQEEMLEKQPNEEELRKQIEQELMEKLKGKAVAQKRPKQIKEASNKIADAIRKLKIDPTTMTGGDGMVAMSSVISVPISLYNSVMESAALAVSGLGSIASVVAKGIETLRADDFYKKLSLEQKRELEQKFKDKINSSVSEVFEDTDELTADKDRIIASIIEKAEGTLHDGLTDLFNKFTYNRVKAGAKEITEIVDQAYEALSEHIDGLTKEELREIISGYGKYKRLSKEEIDKRVRGIKRIGRLVAALDDVRKGRLPRRSGVERDRPSQQARELQKQILEEIKDSGLEEELSEKEIEEQWASAEKAYQNRLENAIADVQREIDTNKRRDRSKKAREFTSERTKELQAQLEDLKRIRDEKLGKPDKTLSDEQRINLIIKATEKAIANIEKGIENIKNGRTELGDIYPEKKKPADSIINDRVKKLRERRDALKEERERLIPESIKAEARIEKFKKNQKRRLKALQDKIAKKDFEKKEKPAPPPLDAEARALELEINKAKEKIEYEIEKIRLQNRTKWQRFAEGFENLFNLPKALMASLDLSAPLRQGVIMIGKPKAFGKAFVDMFRFAFSKKKYEKWLDDFKKTPEYYEFKNTHKLYIAEPNAKLSAKEDAFRTNFLKYVFKIPGYGHLVGGSVRAYEGFLNSLRVQVFNQFKQQLLDEGFSGEEYKREMDVYATFVNAATGRGTLNIVKPKKGRRGVSLEGSAGVLNMAYFAPRLISGRLMAINPGWYATAPKMARKDAMKTMLKFIGIGTAVLTLISFDDDWEAEIDPRSSNFGKIKNKKTGVVMDIWGGFSQIIRTITQVATQSKKTGSGEIKRLSGDEYPFTTAADQGRKFFEYKMSPGASLALSILRDKTDVMGQPLTFKDQLYKNVMPLYLQDVAEIVDEAGWEAALSAGVPAMFGVGIQYHKRNIDFLDNDQAEFIVENDALPTKIDDKTYMYDGEEIELDEQQMADYINRSQQIYKDALRDYMQYGDQSLGGISNGESKPEETREYLKRLWVDARRQARNELFDEWFGEANIWL